MNFRIWLWFLDSFLVILITSFLYLGGAVLLISGIYGNTPIWIGLVMILTSYFIRDFKEFPNE